MTRAPATILAELEAVRARRRWQDLPGLAEQEAALCNEWRDAIQERALSSHTPEHRDAMERIAAGEPRAFAVTEEYWRDPAPFELERVAGQAAIDRLFDKHKARVRAEQERRWAREEIR